MEEQVRANLATERFIAGASTALAVLATLLAGIGLYGVLAFTIAQRSREIALRVALGATGDRIRLAVLRQVATMTLAGAAIGVVAAILIGRAAESLVFEVGAVSPISLSGAATILAIVTLAAAYLPSRQAMRVDPMAALRYD
jgi:ABC-type antimicrobial peptide transport system permease subunit